MFLFSIKNYRGIESAEFVLDPIALICGKNEGGKTSLSQAVAAVITRNSVPVPGVLKSDIGMLLRDNTKRGNCVMNHGEDTTTVSWPGGAITPTGGRPVSSYIAAGLQDLATMKEMDAAKLMIATLRAEPTEAELLARMKESGINAELAANVWKFIAEEGWDKAYKRSKDKSPLLKGAWEQITGQTYGSARADDYECPGYREGVALDTIKGEVDRLSSELEHAIANQAVAADEIERLKALADGVPEAETTIEELNDRHAIAIKAIDRLQDELQALPLPETADTLATCPHCEKNVVVVNRTELKKPEKKMTARENDARQQAIDIKNTAIRKETEEKQAIERHLSEAFRVKNLGIAAGERLASIPGDGVDSSECERLSAELRKVQGQERAHIATVSAREKHVLIQQNNVIAELLAPTGLRQEALESRREQLNARIAELCGIAIWPVFRLDENFRLVYQQGSAGRPYELMAVSARFRAKTMLQIVIAEADGSQVVVIDAADILDDDGRNGLFMLLSHVRIKAVVTMTMKNKGEVPDIGRAGLGHSYWLAESVLWPCFT